MPFAIPSAVRAKARIAVPMLVVAAAALAHSTTWWLLWTMLTLITMIEVLEKAFKHERDGKERWMLGAGYCLPLLAVFGFGLSAIGLLRVETDGVWYILIIAVPVMVCDTAAQLVGMNIRAVNRRPFFPSISPNKTLQGTVGGLLAGVVSAFVVLGIWSAAKGGWPTDERAVIVLACLLGAPLGVAGDLLESWTKRRLGLKDFSSALGAHGGFADRFDALALAFATLGWWLMP